MGWRVDSTNAELEYSRNFLRAQVMPALIEINEQAIAHMNQTAVHLSEIKDYIDAQTDILWNKIAQEDSKITLDVKAIQELHPVMQRQVAYKAIVSSAKRKKDITSVHVDALLALCKGQSGKRISLPYGIGAWKEFDQVYVSVEEKKNAETDKVFEVSLEELEASREDGSLLSFLLGEKGAQITCRIFEKKEQSLEIPRKTYTKWFDYDKIKQGFCIRTRRSGDYFINDELGHRKKLKSYFIDEKIPLTERDNMWLLAKGNEVLWLIGGRISENIKVTQKTKHIFEITYDGGEKDE